MSNRHDLSLAIATTPNGGQLKLVVSASGRVLLDTAARLPHDPTPANYASALRLLAASLDDLKLEPVKG